MLGKGRGIENNEVITGCWVLGVRCWGSYTLQELEGILTLGLMTGITREIQLYVLFGQFDGLS